MVANTFAHLLISLVLSSSCLKDWVPCWYLISMLPKGKEVRCWVAASAPGLQGATQERMCSERRVVLLEQDCNSSCCPLGFWMSPLLGCGDLCRGPTRMLSHAAQATLPSHVYQGLLVQGGVGRPQDSFKHAQHGHAKTRGPGTWPRIREVVFVSQVPEGMGVMGHLPPYPK